MSKADETRGAALDVAVEMASQVGLQGLTIGSLAERADLSKSGLFAHFRSKEALQLAVVAHAADLFVDLVLRPALKAPRGKARVRELFERWLTWDREALSGGCFFVAVSVEFDDIQGPVRELLAQNQRDWLEIVATVFRTGISEDEFAPAADADQFAQDLQGVLLACHHSARLLRDPHAETRARRAFENLLTAARK